MILSFYIISILLLFFISASSGSSSEICFTEDFTGNTSSVVALVLARGGSKGIPRKNLVKLNGVSLLGRTLKTIKMTKLFSKVYVSTEDVEIGLEAVKYGAIVHKRPQYLAKDDTTSIAAVEDFISTYKEYHKIAMFQCTSVFLKASYILEAFNLFQTKECVFSATRSFKLRWSIDKNGFTYPLNFNPKARLRRQDWAGELVENGMFYFAARELLEQNLFQNNRCGIVEISQNDALEVDTLEDFKLVECLFDKNAK